MRCTFVVAAAAGLLAAGTLAEDERLPFIIVMWNQVPLNVLRQAGGGPSSGDPDGPLECGVELIGAARVWNELGITGRGSVVCVIDADDIEGFAECVFPWSGGGILRIPDGQGDQVLEFWLATLDSESAFGGWKSKGRRVPKYDTPHLRTLVIGPEGD